MASKTSIGRHHVLLGLTLLVAALGMPIASGHGPFPAFDRQDPRTIVLTARNMRFNGTNPALDVRPGETVRVILRNEDPGMKHDLVIPGLDLQTPVLEPGEEAVLLFRAPTSGVFEYFCSMHPISMSGFIRIGDPAGTRTHAAP